MSVVCGLLSVVFCLWSALFTFVMIGIDIVEIERIEKLLDRYGGRFLERVFSKREIDLYRKSKKRASFLAGRFAAKEAVIKAVGRYIPLNRIEILGETKPYVHGKDTSVSISHTKEVATAVAITISMPLT